MSAETPQARQHLRTVRRRSYGVLLVAIVCVFLVQGIAEPEAWEQVLVTALLGVTLLLSLRVAEARPWFWRAAIVIVTATTALSAVEAANGVIDSRATRMASALLVALAPPAVVVGVLRGLRRRKAVTIEVVTGGLCVYLLLGLLFANVYGALDHAGSGPFFAGGAPATVSNCVYFSFTTLATLGYGDFTARTNLGHTLSVAEALVGQLYLVTVVALVVGNLGRSTLRSAGPQG